MKSKTTKIRTLGWREWVAIPAWGIDGIKAKVDTGAKSSAVHATDIMFFEKRGEPWVRFRLFPLQRSDRCVAFVSTPVLGFREVTSSNGQKTRRPVVAAKIELMRHLYRVEFTLADRNVMGFRMLLGRTAMRRRFVVDPSRSYVCPQHPLVRTAVRLQNGRTATMIAAGTPSAAGEQLVTQRPEPEALPMSCESDER